MSVVYVLSPAGGMSFNYLIKPAMTWKRFELFVLLPTFPISFLSPQKCDAQIYQGLWVYFSFFIFIPCSLFFYHFSNVEKFAKLDISKGKITKKKPQNPKDRG